MALLDGKRVLVTGVLTEASIAFHVARLAQEQGATVVLSSQARTLRLVERIAKRLPADGSGRRARRHLRRRPGRAARPGRRSMSTRLDGVLHSIGFAPESALGGNFLHTEWPDVAVALQISAFSLKSLTVACRPLLAPGSSVVGLTFDATVAWPTYDWMGVAKAAFESTSRYLARDLGGAGRPGQPGGGRSDPDDGGQEHPGLRAVRGDVDGRGPRSAGTSTTRCRPPRRVALLSDWFPATTRRDRARRRRCPRDRWVTDAHPGAAAARQVGVPRRRSTTMTGR